jgi:hypothetical protein
MRRDATEKIALPRLTFGGFAAKFGFVANFYETSQIKEAVEEAASQSRSTLL